MTRELTPSPPSDPDLASRPGQEAEQPAADTVRSTRSLRLRPSLWWQRRTAVAGVVGLVILAGAATWLHHTTSAEPASTPTSVARLATAPVTSGAVVDATDVRGTLRYADDGNVVSGSSGVLTWLPAPGRTIEPGETLYTVDTRPVVLLIGALPAWRTLRIGMTAGEDVRQLERGLALLGWFDLVPDTMFTTSTATAVRSWQRHLGVEQTGAVERSALMFAEHPLRVASTSVRLGAGLASGAEIYTTTGTDKVVAVDLELNDQQLATPGGRVAVVLPDGTELPASIARVGEAVERSATDGATGKVVVPVAIRLTDQADAARFSEAGVTVRFSSTLAKGLLTVPVQALVAIDDTTFGVEVPAATSADQTGQVGPTTVRPVSVGAFASGRVVISGSGIVAGLRVVVPAP